MARRKTRQKSQLSGRETELCLRIREARDLAEVTQEKLAELIGVPRDRLSTYEKCRAPLRFEIGLRICRQLIISEEWLATGATVALDKLAGKGDLKVLRERVFKRQCYDLLSEPIALAVPPGTLFSEAYERYLAATYADLAKQFFYFPRIVLSDAVRESELASRFVKVIFDRSMLFIDHLAGKAGKVATERWHVQRVFGRAIVELIYRSYREFVELDLDVGDFQHFIRTVERLQRTGDPKESAASRQKAGVIRVNESNYSLGA
jgi:transcriptional regulator with XRE-family HTH domain